MQGPLKAKQQGEFFAIRNSGPAGAIRYGLCLFLLLLAGAPLLAQHSVADRIEALLIEALPDASGPGLTLGVVKDGQLLYQGSRGNMNLAYGLPFNDSTVVGLASVTKQFTAACIGLLERQGKLSLQDDVRKYLPELPFYGDTIRIKHLLHHTSGLRNYNVLLDLKGFDFTTRGYTNETIEELMFRQKGINHPPGEKMLYANTNYVFLALIVERVSGSSLHEFAKQEIFEPLEMGKTFFIRDLETLVPNRAEPYYADPEGYKQPKSLTLCVGAGGMESTVPDLLRWSEVFLQADHEFAYLKDFLTQRDTLNNGEPMSYGRGLFVSPYKGLSTYHHSGRDRGMRSQFIALPALQLAVFVFANEENIHAVNFSYQILDLFVPEPAEAPQKAVTSTDLARALQTHTGTYQEVNSDLRMAIYLENDTLKAVSSRGSTGTSLIPEGPNRFSRIDNSYITYTFGQEESEDDLQVDFGGALFYFEKIRLADTPNQELETYVGTYYSRELDVRYRLQVIEDQLVVTYPNHRLVLSEGQTGVFGANRRTKYSFHKKDGGESLYFEVASEGTVKNILFERVDPSPGI